VADMQQSQRFSVCPLIGPCLHTIRNQDSMVPLEGFEDGLTGRSFTRKAQEAVSERRPLSIRSE
jgi:hypothetical protein